MKKTIIVVVLILALLSFSFGCIKKEIPMRSEKVQPNNTQMINNPQTPKQTTTIQTSNNTEDYKVIKIKYFAFHPNVIRVPVGTKVIWQNEDKNTIHHIISGYLKNGKITSENLFDSGKINYSNTWEYTFSKEGEYPFISPEHPLMQGMVIVGNPQDKIIQIMTPHFVGSIPSHNQTVYPPSNIWITFSVPISKGYIELYDVNHHKEIPLENNGVVKINYLRLKADIPQKLESSLYKVTYHEERAEGNYTGVFFFKVD
jgi:plastocyanin